MKYLKKIFENKILKVKNTLFNWKKIQNRKLEISKL